jgi:hypothetical protein
MLCADVCGRMQKQEAAAAARGVTRVSCRGGRRGGAGHALGAVVIVPAHPEKEKEKEKRKSAGAGERGRAAARANDIQTYVVKQATGLVSPTCTLPYESSPQPTRACKTVRQENPAAPDLQVLNLLQHQRQERGGSKSKTRESNTLKT